MMGEAIQQGRGHFGVAEDAWPFADVEIGGDDHRSPLVEVADQMEQQLAAGLGEREIAEFVEHDDIQTGKPIGETPLA